MLVSVSLAALDSIVIGPSYLTAAPTRVPVHRMSAEVSDALADLKAARASLQDRESLMTTTPQAVPEALKASDPDDPAAELRAARAELSRLLAEATTRAAAAEAALAAALGSASTAEFTGQVVPTAVASPSSPLPSPPSLTAAVPQPSTSTPLQSKVSNLWIEGESTIARRKKMDFEYEVAAQRLKITRLRDAAAHAELLPPALVADGIRSIARREALKLHFAACLTGVVPTSSETGSAAALFPRLDDVATPEPQSKVATSPRSSLIASILFTLLSKVCVVLSAIKGIMQALLRPLAIA